MSTMEPQLTDKCRQCGVDLSGSLRESYISVKSRGELPYYTHRFCNLDHMWLYYSGVVSQEMYDRVVVRW